MKLKVSGEKLGGRGYGRALVVRKVHCPGIPTFAERRPLVFPFKRGSDRKKLFHMPTVVSNKFISPPKTPLHNAQPCWDSNLDVCSLPGPMAFGHWS